MKKKTSHPNKSAKIAILAEEAEAVAAGEAAAARVTEIVLDEAGRLVSRRELDPEAERAAAARDFEVRSDVARIRRRLGITQAAFSSRLGIPLATLQKWERNATQPSGAAAALLRILDRRPEVIEILAEA